MILTSYNSVNEIRLRIYPNCPCSILCKLAKQKQQSKSIKLVAIRYMTSNTMFINACLRSALFGNVSLHQRGTLRWETLGELPGAQCKAKNRREREFSRGPWLRPLASSCSSGVHIRQGLEKREKLKTKKPPIHA